MGQKEKRGLLVSSLVSSDVFFLCVQSSVCFGFQVVVPPSVFLFVGVIVYDFSEERECFVWEVSWHLYLLSLDDVDVLLCEYVVDDGLVSFVPDSVISELLQEFFQGLRRVSDEQVIQAPEHFFLVWCVFV